MKQIITVALLAAVATAKILTEEEFGFTQYISEHSKSYADVAEFTMRFGNWIKKNNYIAMHNANNHKTSVVAHNKFSDWTEEEYQVLLGLKNMPTPPEPESYKWYTPSNEGTMDWRDYGAVTAVKDQGQCGSCYAFSSTGALEGAYVRAGGELQSLSEQQLVDCSGPQGNQACSGGWYYYSFEYWKTNPAQLEASYPYYATQFQCSTVKEQQWLEVGSYAAITPNNPDQMKAALNDRPVSVAVAASSDEFAQYKSGVITGSGCGTDLNHAVLAIGYGTDANGTEYFLVKNSWNTWWGDQGYLRIGISAGKGTCGINQVPYVVSLQIP